MMTSSSVIVTLLRKLKWPSCGGPQSPCQTVVVVGADGSPAHGITRAPSTCCLGNGNSSRSSGPSWATAASGGSTSRPPSPYPRRPSSSAMSSGNQRPDNNNNNNNGLTVGVKLVICASELSLPGGGLFLGQSRPFLIFTFHSFDENFKCTVLTKKS